jgi:hypothetical protein
MEGDPNKAQETGTVRGSRRGEGEVTLQVHSLPKSTLYPALPPSTVLSTSDSQAGPSSLSLRFNRRGPHFL